MKKLLTFCFASTMALVAQADTFTFKPSDADIGDLDHHYAYTWGISWNLPAGTQITGATLSIKNIWDWKAGERDQLYIDLLDNTSTGIKTYLDNTNDNVLSDYFAGKGTALTIFEDDKGGVARNNNFAYNFTSGQLTTLTNYITNGHTIGKADFGISFDPDCHYFNDGITLTITTSRVPDGGLTVALFGLGLLALSRLRRFLS